MSNLRTMPVCSFSHIFNNVYVRGLVTRLTKTSTFYISFRTWRYSHTRIKLTCQYERCQLLIAMWSCSMETQNRNTERKKRETRRDRTHKKKISNNYKYQRAHCTRNLTECNNGVSTHREIQNLLNTRYRCCMKHIFLFSISSSCHSAFAILFERLSDAVLRLLALHTLRIVVFFFLTSSSLLCVCVFGAKQMIRSMYLILFSVLSYRINSIMHTMPYSCVLPIVVLLWCDPACSSALAHNTPRTRMSIIKTLCQ